jgi:thiamine biosynthesis lipoprotein
MNYIENERSEGFPTFHPEERSPALSLERAGRSDEGSVKRMHYLMDTFLSIEVFHSDENIAKQTVEMAFREAIRIENILSRFREGSEVYRVNKHSFDKPQIISEELTRLVSNCIRFSQKTSGAFDITVAPLIELWANAAKKNLFPPQNEISSLLQNTGYENIILDSGSSMIAFAKPLLRIDFGAVGKGYALDRMTEILKENKIEKARLDFGGHLYYMDSQGYEGEAVGIRNPLCPDEVMATVTLKNQSISTSADYERNFNILGRAYSHLINPCAGQPAEGDILSASVISDSSLVSDIFSTAVFILGLKQGMELIEDMDNVEALIITNNQRMPEIHSSLDRASQKCRP